MKARMQTEGFVSSHTHRGASNGSEKMDADRFKDGVYVQTNPNEFARSQYINWSPQVPVIDEIEALKEYKVSKSTPRPKTCTHSYRTNGFGDYKYNRNVPKSSF
jgi:hypothetical protein